ncbi:DUF551 domain-containing protein [Enterobacter roggenkampii]|uniref:DUF551 domain-containing protein n=1 Tax=Enterobacter roggenkampii TaxID=1812935 RepID=UPI0018C2715C|nr:DUF551 domain-containing protein [Enterobacter roggenkampii]MBG0696815.1 DUF551 domain-containing protein [Enterobacter roggenkampii]MEB5886035.1 DUF551 domain-containing protein [Enterobacter roggenkampii]
MQWTPIEAGQPKTTKPISWYIVNTEKGVGFTEYSPMYGFNGVVLIDNKQFSGIKITHWMELPPPPVN